MTVKELTTAVYQQKIKDNKNVPVHAIPRTVYSDKKANDLATAIKAFCDMKGMLCQRTGNEGRYRPGETVTDVIGRVRVMKGTWLPGQNNGMADITVIIKGKVHYVEIKIGRDTQSDVQKTFESQVKKAGATYDIVKSWEDFYKLYTKWQQARG